MITLPAPEEKGPAMTATTPPTHGGLQLLPGPF